MFTASWGEQQAAVALVAAVCILLRALRFEDLTISEEAG
jgi:hypothetical protein